MTLPGSFSGALKSMCEYIPMLQEKVELEGCLE